MARTTRCSHPRRTMLSSLTSFPLLLPLPLSLSLPLFALSTPRQRQDFTPSLSSFLLVDTPRYILPPPPSPLVSQCRLSHVPDYALRRSWLAVNRASTHFTRAVAMSFSFVATDIQVAPSCHGYIPRIHSPRGETHENFTLKTDTMNALTRRPKTTTVPTSSTTSQLLAANRTT